VGKYLIKGGLIYAHSYAKSTSGFGFCTDTYWTTELCTNSTQLSIYFFLSYTKLLLLLGYNTLDIPQFTSTFSYGSSLIGSVRAAWTFIFSTLLIVFVQVHTTSLDCLH